jgi:DNA polymerase III subunit gamma/tau
MGYEPLHHKYRPQTFTDLVGQEAIATTLTNALTQERIAPAYLFTGARGTGKTSSARIMAKSLNCISFDKPTAHPCGTCSMCREITKGTALDITEIDAASNTGVDNIRELIERSQFAPVQARYKVYAIDECLTGDSLIMTNEGLVRIDDLTIKGKEVLSYNDAIGKWEFKKVLRWLNQGTKPILKIKTAHREIRCTENHLIRTEQGWIPAKNVKEGMTILSPVNVAVESSSLSTGQMDASADLSQGINSSEIHLDKKNTILPQFFNNLSFLNHFVHVGAEKSSMFQIFCCKKEKESRAFSQTGQGILIKKDTVSGNIALKNSLLNLETYLLKNWDLSTVRYSATVPLATQTSTVDFPGWLGITARSSTSGSHIKLAVFPNCDQNLKSPSIKDSVIHLFTVEHSAILSSRTFLLLLDQISIVSSFLWNGLAKLLPKVWLGGIWMTDHSYLAHQEAQECHSLLKAIRLRRMKPSLIGLQEWDTKPKSTHITDLKEIKPITTSAWAQTSAENGCQISSNTQSPQWHTSLEKVESVKVAGVENVYDIEVEDNHNFVANGLLVHNCHMLSTAAFNALLKTLEEPPDRVVFILATTDPQRVLPTIISRCQRFDFRRIPLDAMVKHLGKIAEIEKINIQSEALTLVSQIAQGGLRDAESLLDQLSLLEGEITVEAVWELVGSVPEKDLLGLLEAIANNNSTLVIDLLRRVMDRGREPLIVLQNLAGLYRDLLIAKTASDRHDLVAFTASGWAGLKQLSQTLAIADILAGQQHLRSAELQIKNTTQPRLWLEITLMGLLPSVRSQQAASVQQPVARIPQVAIATPAEPVQAPIQAPLQPEAKPHLQELEVKPSQDTLVVSSPPEVPFKETPLTHSLPPTSTEPPPLNLDREWHELLSYLTPAPKGLMNDHAKFIEVTQTTVRIGFKNATFKKIADQKRDEVAECCTRVFHRPMKVSFEVLSAGASSSKKNTQAANTPQSSPQTSQQSSHQTPQQSSPQKNSQPTPSPSPLPVQTPPQSATEPATNAYMPKSSEFIAAQNVAKFFDGEIVNLDNEPGE